MKNTKDSQIVYVTYYSKKKDRTHNELLKAIKRYKSERITSVHKKAQAKRIEFRILSGYFGLIDPTKKIPFYDFLLVCSKDKERLKYILDNQFEQLKDNGINKIEYYTKNLKDPANSKIVSYYEVIEVTAKKKS